jgi:adenylosuccinate synthase
VTTPFDMLVNQAVELARGTGRHGSCGVGFGETIERCLVPVYSLTVADLSDEVDLPRRLEAIRRDWVPTRLAGLGVTTVDGSWKPYLETDLVARRWLGDVAAFRTRIRECSLVEATAARELVFEGAQGLLLDQEHRPFPDSRTRPIARTRSRAAFGSPTSTSMHSPARSRPTSLTAPRPLTCKGRSA